MRFINSVAITLALTLAPALVAKLPTPRPAPAISIAQASGKPIQLADYRGKVVMIQFLITNCTHCQATARMFTEIQNQYAAKGLQVLGIAFNEDALASWDPIRGFVANNHVGFPVGSATRDQVLGYLGVSVMEESHLRVPQVMIVDRKGKIRAQSEVEGSPEFQQPEKLRPLLEKLLAEGK